ncbi:uncharacterized protein BXIN_0383 [Babesia sp. Xinjiang]|uniref:uncharacterized protein n=1 Tax=Babesia sp. Xinjiang TaxID=462227 RepID=UPI000A221601|nr:uncharacterized protein BXIN_0383 [Babesia sp. Xinjiang]ORM41068.1 hypothetical protein BXIN_0383 [Babesia sp. Xinjiang]
MLPCLFLLPLLANAAVQKKRVVPHRQDISKIIDEHPTREGIILRDIEIAMAHGLTQCKSVGSNVPKKEEKWFLMHGLLNVCPAWIISGEQCVESKSEAELKKSRIITVNELKGSLDRLPFTLGDIVDDTYILHLPFQY